MKIQILGMGCWKCQKLTAVAKQAAEEMRLTLEIEKITNPEEFPKFGVMMTPALAVDGVVKVAGKIPSVEDLKKLLVHP